MNYCFRVARGARGRGRWRSLLSLFIRNRTGYGPLAATFVLFFSFSYILQPPLYKLFNPGLRGGFPAFVDSAISLLIATMVMVFFLAGATSVRFRRKSNLRAKEIEFPFLVPVFIAVVLAGFMANWALLSVGGGVTIYTYGIQMPGSFSGVMSAMRVVAFPAVLAILVRFSSVKNPTTGLFVLLGTAMFGAISSLASGSHLVAVATALPLLFTFSIKLPGRLTLFGFVLALQLITAAGSRIFFLPFWYPEDWTIHDFYFEAWILAGSPILPLILTPILYPINRTSGLFELSLTAKFFEGSYFNNFSLSPTLSYFIPGLGAPNPEGAREVLNVGNSIGGFGLDLVSNLWISFGPNLAALCVGSALLGLTVGTAYRSIDRFLTLLEIPSATSAVSLGLLLLVFSPSLGPLLLGLAILGLSSLKIIEFFHNDQIVKIFSWIKKIPLPSIPPRGPQT